MQRLFSLVKDLIKCIKSLIQLHVPQGDIIEAVCNSIASGAIRIIKDKMPINDTLKLPTSFEIIGIYNDSEWLTSLSTDSFEEAVTTAVLENLNIVKCVEAIAKDSINERMISKLWKVINSEIDINFSYLNKLFYEYLMQQDLDEIAYISYPDHVFYFEDDPTDKDLFKFMQYILRCCLTEGYISSDPDLSYIALPYEHCNQIQGFFSNTKNLDNIFKYIGTLISNNKIQRVENIPVYCLLILSKYVEDDSIKEDMFQKIVAFQYLFDDKIACEYVDNILDIMISDMISEDDSYLKSLPLTAFINFISVCFHNKRGTLEKIHDMLLYRLRSSNVIQDIAMLSKDNLNNLHEVFLMVETFTSL